MQAHINLEFQSKIGLIIQLEKLIKQIHSELEVIPAKDQEIKILKGETSQGKYVLALKIEQT